MRSPTEHYQLLISDISQLYKGALPLLFSHECLLSKYYCMQTVDLEDRIFGYQL